MGLRLVHLIAVGVAISFGCENPARGPRNSQPVVEGIPDITITYRGSKTIEVRITDNDIGDRHTVKVTCGNRNIARASVKSQDVTIEAGDAGVTDCSVNVTDSSGEGNAESEEVNFQVTVQPLVNLGDCRIGMKVRVGEGCYYYSGRYTTQFSVKDNGNSCRESDKEVYREVFGVQVRLGLWCVGYDINGDEAFGEPNFSAERNSDGSWTITDVP